MMSILGNKTLQEGVVGFCGSIANSIQDNITGALLAGVSLKASPRYKILPISFGVCQLKRGQLPFCPKYGLQSAFVNNYLGYFIAF